MLTGTTSRRLGLQARARTAGRFETTIVRWDEWRQMAAT